LGNSREAKNIKPGTEKRTEPEEVVYSFNNGHTKRKKNSAGIAMHLQAALAEVSNDADPPEVQTVQIL